MNELKVYRIQMITKNSLTISLIFISAFLISSCSVLTGQSAVTTTEVPIVTQQPGVIAEGKLVPQKFVSLAFTTGGKVEQLLVAEGERVEQGQVIARLDQREQLTAAVDAAQLELTNSQLALKDLDENASVVTALAIQKVADQRYALREAERYLNNLKSGGKPVDINAAKATVVILKDRLDAALKDFAPYEKKPEDDIKRAALLSKYTDAQRNYDNAVRLLNNLQGSASEIDSAIAEANLSLAQASLALAEQDYERVKDGPDSDLLALAQARLQAARTGLDAAQAALANRELVAPFSGTIAKLSLKVGEQALPGQPAVVLADFSGWVVETDDLTETEVTKIVAGQSAQITFDALPELTFVGTVDSISDLNTDRNGDVTYTTRVTLRESDPRLRWGMSALVRFEDQ